MPLSTIFYNVIRNVATENPDKDYLLRVFPELTTNTTQTPSLFPDWPDFSVESKTKLVMLELLMQELNLTRQQAFEQWQDNKRSLNRLLDKRRHKALERIWQDLFSSQRHQISVALTIKKWLTLNSALSYEAVLAQAKHLFQQEALRHLHSERAVV